MKHNEPAAKLPTIPGYKIIRHIGKGGYADVYQCIQEKFDRVVAVKVILPYTFRDHKVRKRFIREAETATTLDHPNIVILYDVGQADDLYYISMEYLPQNLKNKIITGSFSADNALITVKAIASALSYAHRKGFIHRDIKPENIMFREDGTPVMVDFGVAKAVEATTKITSTGLYIGTPHYMSPEQAQGKKLDARADIYSLGVLFYEMLTGKVPYDAETPVAVILKHLQYPVPKLPEKVSCFQALIQHMMAKDRTKRIQSCDSLLKILDAGALKARPTVISQNHIDTPQEWEEEMFSIVTDADKEVKHQRHWLRRGMLALFFACGLACGLLLHLLRDKTADSEPPATAGQTLNAEEQRFQTYKKQALEAMQDQDLERARYYLNKAKTIREDYELGKLEGLLEAAQPTGE